MTTENCVAKTSKATGSAPWRKPEVLRLEAGKAEIGSATNTDAINTAS